jgi:hypothetical protein
MIGREWSVLIQGRSSSSIHYGPEDEIKRIAKASELAGARAVDGPRVRTEWEALTLEAKVARGLKTD